MIREETYRELKLLTKHTIKCKTCSKKLTIYTTTLTAIPGVQCLKCKPPVFSSKPGTNKQCV